MPHLVAIALVGAGLYAGFRWVRKTAEQIRADMDRARDEAERQAQAKGKVVDLGRLEYDPTSGVYKPVK
jgi:hypothetical protein